MNPHTNMVVNLNADLLDGYHATNLPYLGTNYQFVEHDPQVGEIAPNYVPHWVGTSLVTGTIFDNGNIGIGTPNPTGKLDVRSETDYYLLALAAGVNKDTYLRAGNAASGVVRIGDDQTAKTIIQPFGGSVGIGTPAPSRLLDVSSAGTSYITIRGNNAAGNAAILEFYDTSSAHNWQIGMGDTELDNDLKFYKGTDGLAVSELMRITDAGNVGIGTVNPGYKLQVNGGDLVKSTTIGWDNTWDNVIKYITRQDVGFHPNRWIGADATITAGSAGANKLKFRIYQGAAAPDQPPLDVMTLQGDGKVGIGTVNPSSPLHIGQSSNDRDGGLYVQRAGTPYGAVMYVDGDGRVRIGTKSDDPALPYDADYITLATGSGNVGIGTESPGFKLEVNGNVGVRGPLYALDQVGIGIYPPDPSKKLDVNGDALVRGKLTAGWIQTDWYYWPPDNKWYLPFLHLRDEDNYTALVPPPGGFRVTDYKNIPEAGGHNNLILTDNGNLWIRGSYYPTSDLRLKANQEPLDYGLAEILKLKPMRFLRVDWTMNPETGEIDIDETSSKNDFGLNAQDVYEIMPEAVKKPEDETTEYWGLAYDNLVAVLAKAIQEQQQTITNQQTKIESLEQRIIALEQK